MKLSTNRSFTIVEALLAIILIAVIVVIFFASLMVSFDNLRRVIELRTATLVLQEQLSMVRELPFSSVESLGGAFSSSGMSSLNNAAGTIAKSSYGGQPNIVKITFRLDWTAFNGKSETKTLITLITDHGIDKK